MDEKLAPQPPKLHMQKESLHLQSRIGPPLPKLYAEGDSDFFFCVVSEPDSLPTPKSQGRSSNLIATASSMSGSPVLLPFHGLLVVHSNYAPIPISGLSFSLCIANLNILMPAAASCYRWKGIRCIVVSSVLILAAFVAASL